MPSIGGSAGGSPSGGSSGPAPGSSGIAAIFGGNPIGDEISFGGRGGGFGSSLSNSALIDFLMTPIPVVGPLNALSAMLGFNSFGQIAQGDPNPAFGRGVSGAGGSGGVGGGPAGGGSTFAQRALTAPIRAAALAPRPVPKAKAPEKKRIGRQETILTSGLSDATTFKPTLLGQ